MRFLQIALPLLLVSLSVPVLNLCGYHCWAAGCPAGLYPVYHAQWAVVYGVLGCTAWIVAVYSIYALEKTIRLRETPAAEPPEKSPGE